MASPTTGHPAASTSNLAAQTLAQTDIPSEYVPKNERGEIDPDALVSVTHGYGRLPYGWRNYIDHQLFVGGIARNVRFGWVQEVRRRAPGTILHTFAPDATETDFVRVCGMSPELLDPVKQAALLAALDPSQVVNAMGREAVVALCEKLLKAVDAPAGRGNAQPSGRTPSDLAAIRALGINRPAP